MSRSNRWGIALRAAWMVFAAVLLVARTGHAQPIARDDVPPELRPWIQWVLEDAGAEMCTSVNGTPTCVWPGRLSLEATATGAHFELDVVVESRSSVALPGNVDLWPEDVKVGTTEAIVTGAAGVPLVGLGAGTHHIEGRIPWKTRPDVLPVPADAGRVALKLDGEAVATRWEGAGRLWLTKDGTSVAPEDPAAKEQERLELEVFRRIEDGVPLVVTTFLDLRVAGAPREVHLGKPVLPGGVLLEVTAKGLPIRMEGSGSDGDMVVGVTAGNHRIELRERHAKPPEELSLEARPAPWPADEIWALQPRIEQRQIEPSGIPSVDPSRTNAPAEWRALQMFKAHAPAKLVLKTTRRGNPEPPPNKLKLSRSIWLDATGSGYTVVDHFEGTMTRDFRLDFSGPGELGNVALRNGRDQLISVSSDRSLPGVELRDGNVTLAAEWRSEEALGAIPAIGWSTDVESLDTTLSLPPGWESVAATGADGVYGEWGADWEVIDFAILLGIALAVGRVFGPKWGLLAAAAVVASHQGQPALRWWILGAVAMAAIVKLAAPGGRLLRAARLAMRGAALVAAWLALHMAARDARRALWPAVDTVELLEQEMEEREPEYAVASADNKEGGTGTRAKGEEGSMGAPSTKASGMRYGVRGPSDNEPTGKAAERSADEIVQTGHGVPRWEFRSASTVFAGAVDRGRMLRFYLLSPWQSAAVGIGRAAVVLAMAWLLLREAFRAGGPSTPSRGAPYRAAAAIAAAFFCMLIASVASAEQPSAETLADLRTRLTRPAACAPACADVASMKIDASGGSLTVVLRAHAEAASAIVLPGGAEAWVPTRIDVDGKRATALRTEGGAVLLRLARGTHDIELEGPVIGTGFTLTLGTRPHRVRTSLRGWTLEGLDDEGVPSGDSLVFHKTGDAEPAVDDATVKPPADAPPETLTIPPWLEVTRTLELGVTWTVTTTIKRVTATGPAITLALPILEGEKVVEGGARMAGGKVTVDLGRDAKEAKFVSAVTPRESIVLQATEKDPWSESWIIRCSVIWQCRSEGVPPIDNRADGTLQATFRPWPGEKLTVHLVRPPPAKGISTTIEQAILRLTPSDSTTEATLSLAIRTSTGGTQAITLPAGARITELTVNGTSQPSPDAAALRVPLSPGRSAINVAFKLDEGRGVFFRAPAIDLGGAATNARVEVLRPGERTVLWTGGGSWGPVVLIWPLMLLLAAIGLALSRLQGSPLSAKQWLVLAPGLTQAPAIVSAIVVAWIFLVHHRRDREHASRAGDAVKQIGIAAFTFAALGCLATCLYIGVTRPRTLLETEVWRAGSDSSPNLSMLTWYFDHSASGLARPWLVSTPEWAWKIAMLGWAVAVFLVLSPFLKSAAARYAEGGVFRRPALATPIVVGATAVAASVAAPVAAPVGAPVEAAAPSEATSDGPGPAPEHVATAPEPTAPKTVPLEPVAPEPVPLDPAAPEPVGDDGETEKES